MAKKDNSYFNDFIAMIGYSCQAAEYLQAALTQFHPEGLIDTCRDMHTIEQAEDQIKHTLMKRLAKEFVPPIDREDIIKLSDELDNITDKIEDILIRLYMYNIKTIRPDTLDFVDVIVRCCQELQQAMSEFPNFLKSKTLIDKIIKVNEIEEEGDQIYIAAVRNLYEYGSSPIEIFVWSTLYDLLEDCCDTCEHVANELHGIIMKNS